MTWVRLATALRLMAVEAGMGLMEVGLAERWLAVVEGARLERNE